MERAVVAVAFHGDAFVGKQMYVRPTNAARKRRQLLTFDGARHTAFGNQGDVGGVLATFGVDRMNCNQVAFGVATYQATASELGPACSHADDAGRIGDRFKIEEPVGLF